MSPALRRAAWTIVGLLIGGALLYVALRGVSWSEVTAQLAGARPGYVAFALALSPLFIAIKTLRWVELLRPIRVLRFNQLHGPVYAGSAANLAISHLGELVRARLVTQSTTVPTSSLLASIGLERVLDFFGLLVIIGGLALAMQDGLTERLATAAEVVAVLSLVAAFALASIVWWSDAWRRIIARCVGLISERARDWTLAQFEHAVGGLASLRHPRILCIVLLLTLLQWSVIGVSVWSCAQAVGAPADLVAAFGVLVLMIVGLTLPTAPVYLGTTQLAFTVALAVYGIDEAAAFAASVVYTGFVVLPMFLIGAACLLFSSRRSAEPAAARFAS